MTEMNTDTIQEAALNYGFLALADDPSFKNDEQAWEVLAEHFTAGVNWIKNLQPVESDDVETAAVDYSRKELGENVFARPDHKEHAIAIQNDFKAGVLWFLDQRKEVSNEL